MLLQYHKTAECCKSALETTSNGIKLPLSVMSVKLSDNYSSLNGEILSKIVMDQFHIICFIYQTDIRIGNLSEILASFFRFINGNCKCDSLNICRNFCKINQICSSSPSPSPVRLSPICSTDSLACFRLP